MFKSSPIKGNFLNICLLSSYPFKMVPNLFLVNSMSDLDHSNVLKFQKKIQIGGQYGRQVLFH